MNTLIPLLIETLKNIEPAAGADAESLRGLLRNLAATRIQLDPSQAVIPPGDIDPRIVEAINAGVELVAVLGKTSTRLRLFEEKLPRGTPAIGDDPEQAGEQASEIFGPFVGRQGVLERIKAFRSGAFLRVLSHFPVFPVGPNELQILIPAASTPDAPDLRNWTLAPGSVWIASRFLVNGTTGFTGLRIKGGTMQLDAASRTDAVTIQLPPGLPAWSLSLEPEPAAPSGAGSDAEALALTLPTRLDVHFHAPAVVSGAPALSGFGSDIHFTMSGTPHTAASQILFPMQGAEPTWSITGNASSLAAFSGESAVDSADYALTISSTDPDFLAEAAHGGSLVVRLGTPFSSSFAAQQGGASNWLQTTLTANALQLELDCGEADSAARYDLDLWTTITTAVRFAGQSLSGLFFRSERGAGDTVVVLGGAIRNQWDLPCGADGQPFPFAGRTDTFGLFSNSAGTWITVFATASVPDLLQGLTLENLHLVVKAPRKLFALAPFDTAPQLSSGVAIFQFDVGVAVPILPDPYAVNLAPPDSDGTVESALGVTLAWTGGQTPALSVTLFNAVPFPEHGPFADPDSANPDEAAVYQAFETHLQCQKTESLYMLDLSSNEHLFGVALESAASINPKIIDNRLSVPLNRIRLLLQPQVQWEPVLDEPNPDAGPSAGVVHSFLEGGPSLVGANSVKLVPVLAANLSGEILEAIRDGLPAAALFSLPFGLRAAASLDFRPQIVPEGFLPATFTFLNEPALGGLKAARQLRLIATGFGRPILPSLAMPGIMRQLENLDANSSLRSVLPSDLRNAIAALFTGSIPLTHADLSGYGLSTFSEWHNDLPPGGGPQFTKVEFRVLNGRTAYEVIQLRSILYECGARVVRTVVLERHNSGRVIRKDSGWVAVDAGQFAVPIPFQKGAVNSFRNIRRIRVTGAAPIDLGDLGEVEPVIFDADADIEGAAGPVPMYDRPGYIQTFPPPPLNPKPVPLPRVDLTPAQLKVLFERVHGISGSVDCAVRLGKTLDAQISSIVSDVALDDNGGIGFAVAVVGAPKLPRAGQWTIVKVDPLSHAASAVDPRRGVPFVRNLADPFRFREPSDTRLKNKNPSAEYALMMATESSRALFERPSLDPGSPGKLSFDVPPLLADPYSLVDSTGVFPPPGSGLRAKETSFFEITQDNLWRLDKANFTVDDAPSGDFLKGGGWGLTRTYADAGQMTLNIDSATAKPFQLEAPLSNLNLALPAPLAQILSISTTYQSVAGGLPQFAAPTLVFSGALNALTSILDSLKHLINLELPINVSVKPKAGPSPSFVVHLDLSFGLGDGPDGRSEIGVGKFRGLFELNADLETALTGVDSALLSLDFQGDVQQGIIPPLIYAGGFFRFSIELGSSGPPVIQVALGIVTSVGGDLIPGLISLEATLNEGYSLIPTTLAPGVLLGVEARAKVLDGLIGLSFSAEVMASVERQGEFGMVTIAAQLKIAATVHVAIFLNEDFHLETQFHQDIPLAAVGAILGPEVALIVSPEAIPL